MAGACQGQELHAANARLWADALAADPSLAGHERREHALQAAALAGCGFGNDAAGLTEGQRARWRELGRAWLRAELAAAIIQRDYAIRMGGEQ
jgi:hypothetical protein